MRGSRTVRGRKTMIFLSPCHLSSAWSLVPGAMSQVRIMKQNTARLPQDRESLFYFDLREIPPQPDLQGKNSAVMQLAMQSRIKLFYRPAALQTENIQEQAIKLKVTQNGNWLTINNPTPYHITIAWMGQEGQTLNGFKGDMVAPFDSISVKAPIMMPKVGQMPWISANAWVAPHQEVSVQAERQLPVGLLPG
ncbi:molecular chaperone [Salmonella enterica subsp. diarizonae]|nr:molecular chaperone [Salmonella enterica subsp. diarizonae]